MQETPTTTKNSRSKRPVREGEERSFGRGWLQKKSHMFKEPVFHRNIYNCLYKNQKKLYLILPTSYKFQTVLTFFSQKFVSSPLGISSKLSLSTLQK